MTHNERNCQSDLIRTLGMIFVIAIHTKGVISEHIVITTIFLTLFFTSVSMFYMVSGKYNLKFNTNNDSDKNAYTKYYKKKFISILIPFIIYSIIIYLYNIRFDLAITPPPKNLVIDFFMQFFNNSLYYHLWFMYPLIGMLISAPFLSKMLNALSDYEIKLLLIISILWNIVSIIIMSELLNYGWAFSCWILSSWLLYFVLGYCCDRISINKSASIYFIIIGLICSVVTVLQAVFLPDRSINLYDISPFYTFVVLGMYIFLDRICIINNPKIKKIIHFFARYSFSIYLIHAPILVDVINKTSVLELNEFLIYFINISLTFSISFAFALCIDTIIINPVKKLLSKLLRI